MKKLSVFSILLILTVILLSACQKNIDPTDILEQTIDEFSLKEMTDITSVDELYQYYVISPADVDRFAACIELNEQDDYTEIVLIKAPDAATAESISALLYNHLDSRLSYAYDYAPDIAPMLEDSVVTTKQNYAVMVISENAYQISSYILENI